MLQVRSKDLRIAIVSDGIWVYGGAERVLETLLQMYPSADVFALVDTLTADSRRWLGDRKVMTSFMQRFPASKHYFRKLLNLWPIAIEQFDLSQYDLIVSSHFAVSHGVITGPSQTHISYTHTPMRYAWDLQAQYLQEANLTWGVTSVIVRNMLHRLRIWDTAAARRVNRFSVNSGFVGRRVAKYYGRKSEIIYPPVFLDRFTFRERKSDFYLYLGRLVAYKGISMIADAFAKMPDKKLIIAGDGPLLKVLRARATSNIQVIGPVDAARADELMGNALAYVCAAIEDFGIAAVEAQAAGTPVIGLGVGGLCETVCDLDTERPTGLFFYSQTVDALCGAVETFERERSHIRPLDCQVNAARFAPDRFRRDFQTFVNDSLVHEVVY